MASLTHSQTRSVVSTGYRVVETVTTATGIPAEVFVVDNDGNYSRIASVLDLQTLPTTPTTGFDYYRVATLTRDFTSLGEAQTFSSGVKSLIAATVAEYAQATAAFVGSDTLTVTS